MLKNKIITSESMGEFEDAMDIFIKDLASYSIQYKPIFNNHNIWYTALITYQEPEKEENNVTIH